MCTAATSVVVGADVLDGSVWIPSSNPGGNRNWASWPLLVNRGDAVAEVAMAGTDDAGNSSGEAVCVIVPAQQARALHRLGAGGGQVAGPSSALGEGTDQWRLRVSAPGGVEALSPLGLPTGHITNLSTTPRHPPA